MSQQLFIVVGILGLAAVALLWIASLRRWAGTPKLQKFVCVLTTCVGLALIAMSLTVYCCGMTNVFDAVRNCLLNGESTLRDWFSSLRLW